MKYADLKIEITRIWKCKKIFIVPIIIGALGSIPKVQLKKLHLPSSAIQKFQKLFYIPLHHCYVVT